MPFPEASYFSKTWELSWREYKKTKKTRLVFGLFLHNVDFDRLKVAVLLHIIALLFCLENLAYLLALQQLLFFQCCVSFYAVVACVILTFPFLCVCHFFM